MTPSWTAFTKLRSTNLYDGKSNVVVWVVFILIKSFLVQEIVDVSFNVNI